MTTWHWWQAVPNYNDEAGIYPKQPGNEDLGWEQTWANNVGVRMGLFNRANVNIDFYHKKTSNMLMLVPQSYAVTGDGYSWGKHRRNGKPRCRNQHRRRHHPHQRLHMERERQCFLQQEQAGGTLQRCTGIRKLHYRTEVRGRPPVHEFFMNRYAGVNPANGDALWYTKDGELTTEFREEDKVMTGKTFDSPWAGGFGTTFAWKGLSLSAQFSWMADRYVMNNDRFFEESNGLYSAYNQSNDCCMTAGKSRVTLPIFPATA